MKHLFPQDRPFPLAIALVLFLIPFLHVITAMYVQHTLLQASSPGQKYNQVTGRDLYAATMLEGARGYWSTRIPYTTSVQPRIVEYYPFFILLGHVSRVLNIDHIVFFQMSTIFTGIFLLLATFWGLHLLFPQRLALLAFFLIHAVETGIYLPALRTFSEWSPSFFMQQVLYERHFGLPHHSLGKAMGILVCILYLKSLETKKPWILIALGICSVLAASTMPPMFIVVGIACIGPSVLMLILTRRFHRQAFMATLIPALSGGITLLWLKYKFSVIPALAVYTEREKTWWTTADILTRYASSLLLYYPLLFIALIGIIVSWKELSFRVKSLVLILFWWLVFPILLIPISTQSWFPVANARLVDGYQYFPAGLLSAVGILLLIHKLRGNAKKIFLPLVCIVTFVISSFVSYRFVTLMVTIKSVGWTNIYPRLEFWDALPFFRQVPPESGVLINDYLGEILPSYALVHTYAAAPGMTWPHFDTRKQQMISFYTGTLSEENAKLFLTENNIHYVYYGLDEMNYTTTQTLYPSLLELVYQTKSSQIFQVKNE